MALTIQDRSQRQTIERDSAWGADRYRLTTHIADVWLRDAGQWASVDERLVDDGTDGFAAQVRQLRHRVRLAEDGGRRWYPRRDVLEFLSFGQIEYWTGATWATLTLGTPTRTGNVLEWDRTQFTLRMIVTWKAVKFEIVLKTSAAARRIRWPISLTGLTWDDWQLRSVSDGTIVGSVMRPWAEDATGTRYTVTPSYADGYVEFTASLAGATFPVVVDPTLTTPQDSTVADTYVASSSAITNYGVTTTFTATSTSTGLLKFDLSAISGKTLSSANLHLFCGAAGWFDRGTLNCARVLSANSGWVEGAKDNANADAGESCWNYKVFDTVRWAGDTGSDGGTDAGCSVSGTDYSSTTLSSTALGNANLSVGYEWTISWDLTELATMASSNYGAALRDSSAANVAFCSSDHATSTYRPYLVVEYVTVPVLAATQHTTHIDLSW